MLKICEECEAEFIPTRADQRFCCRACAKRNNGRESRITTRCEKCGVKFRTSRKSPAKYCPDCYARRGQTKVPRISAPKSSKPKPSKRTSLCLTCARARALPDHMGGCAWHYNKEVVYEEATVRLDVTGKRPYLIVTVTDCKYHEYSDRGEVAI